MKRVIACLLATALFCALLPSRLTAQADAGITPGFAAAFMPAGAGRERGRAVRTDTEEGTDFEESVALPSEWTGLSAFRATDGVTLRWSTASERGSAWFKIDARYEGSGGWQVLDIVPAAGESSSPRFYAWRHHAPPPGRIEYRLRQIDAFGEECSTGMLRIEAGSVPDLLLRPCTPNPATTETLVSIDNGDTATGRLVIEDAEGRVRLIVFGHLELLPGSYRFRVDTSTLPAGAYRIRLDTDAGRRSRELVVRR